MERLAVCVTVCGTASKISKKLPNGDLGTRCAEHLNVSFNYVEGESLIMALKDSQFLQVPPVRQQA